MIEARAKESVDSGTHPGDAKFSSDMYLRPELLRNRQDGSETTPNLAFSGKLEYLPL